MNFADATAIGGGFGVNQTLQEQEHHDGQEAAFGLADLLLRCI